MLVSPVHLFHVVLDLGRCGRLQVAARGRAGQSEQHHRLHRSGLGHAHLLGLRGLPQRGYGVLPRVGALCGGPRALEMIIAILKLDLLLLFI